MPKVTVVLPNYNYARFLHERIRSILQQTFTDFELLYIDDASTDTSNLIAEQYRGDQRVSIHQEAENSGRVYQRWNEGAMMGTGEWLWFAGADDVAHPQFLSQLLVLADRYPTAGIVHCGKTTMNSEGRLIAYPEPDRMYSEYYSRGLDEIPMLMGHNYPRCASFVLIRRNDFESAGGFDSRLWLAADWDLYLTMMRGCDVAYTPDILGSYRSHPVTVTLSTRSNIRFLEDAYCQARAIEFMRTSQTYSSGDLARAVERLRVSLFDLFADPRAVVPTSHEFAAQTINSVLPDRRLRPPWY